jgi:hypothetical protein
MPGTCVIEFLGDDESIQRAITRNPPSDAAGPAREAIQTWRGGFSLD